MQTVKKFVEFESAFPMVEKIRDPGNADVIDAIIHHPGMSLHDYYVGQALADATVDLHPSALKAAAIACFEMADLIMAIRAERKAEG